MRHFLTHLLLLGVFAGLGVRAFGNPVHQEKEPVCVNCAANTVDHGQDREAFDSPLSGGEHCPDCPGAPHEHHHHACHCSMAGAMILGEQGMVKLACLDESRLVAPGSEDMLPDSPVLSEDKPPLI